MKRRSASMVSRRTLLLAGLSLPVGLVVACGSSPAAVPTAAPTIAIGSVATVAPTPAPSKPAATPAATVAAPIQPTATVVAATTVVASPVAKAPASSPAAVSPAPAQSAAKLNLNTATREQFLTVPGVGDRMVREFLEYRPYTSIQQFRREIGKYVPQEQVTAYEQFVFVPVVPNSADADTLRQVPGVDATVATQLAAGRPYASADAFLTKLGQYLSADQVAAARGYLATA